MSALEKSADIIRLIRTADAETIHNEVSPEDLFGTILVLADELKRRDDDATLGALVRQMPTGWCLWQVPREGVWYWHVDDDEDGPVGYGLTPEAALQEALKEQDE